MDKIFSKPARKPKKNSPKLKLPVQTIKIVKVVTPDYNKELIASIFAQHICNKICKKKG